MSGGIAAIQARISAIQSRFEPLSGVGGVLGGSTTTPTDRTAGTDPTGGFDAAMQAALAQAGGTAPTTATTLSAMGLGGSSGSMTASPAISVQGDLSGARTPAVRKASYGPLQPPAELVAYGNGRIPPTALAEIGHGAHRLHAPAARSFRQLDAAARADGVNIGVTDSYRSYEAQVDLARRKGLYSQGGLAATPGKSNHGWGMSLDLDLDAKALSWMREHAADFGFVEDTPREPWHWTYRPA